MKEFILSAPPRLLLFDLDGTLLDSSKRISERNLKAIAQCRQRGIMIGVATARSEPTCARFVNSIQPELLISNSGALVRLRGRVIYQCGFSSDETAALVGAGVAERRGITVDCDDVTYSNRYISFFNEPGMAYTEENCSWLAFSDCDWFKFSKDNVSKGDALRHVILQTGIQANEMIAFGDDFVDMEMLKVCGTGIAMANAVDEVKAQADFVIGDNDSDAIAAFLLSYIL